MLTLICLCLFAWSIFLYDEIGIIPLICATVLTAVAMICEKDED